MRYDPQKHHRRSIRLPEYDYAQAGAYFVSIVCQNRACLLEPAPVRTMIQTWWNQLSNKSPPVQTDAFVVMPNHVHGIVVLTDPVGANLCVRPEPGADTQVCPYTDSNSVGVNPHIRPGSEQTHGSAPTDAVGTVEHPRLGRVVQWFKTMTTNAYIRGVKQDGWEPFPGKLWQRNYYEHVIRDEDELNRVRTYIETNPARWDTDSENPNALGRR